MREQKRNRMVLLAVCFVFACLVLWTENADAGQINSITAAKQKALKKVPGAVVIEVDSDYEKGVLVYEVDLIKGNKEYNIKYRASNSKILEYSWEMLFVKPERQNELISKSRCRQLARKKVKNGKILSCVKKTDDGVDIYKVKLKTGKKRFTLKYHARTGALIDYEWEIAESSGSSGSKGGYIGVSKAKQIALAAVPGAIVVKAEFDMDDGVPVYEVELILGNYEYEFKIHAKTGKILKQERDWID